MAGGRTPRRSMAGGSPERVRDSGERACIAPPTCPMIAAASRVNSCDLSHAPAHPTAAPIESINKSCVPVRFMTGPQAR